MQTPTNQLIKDTVALKQKKFRDETGLILVEGPHPIEEALRAGLAIRHAFVLKDQPVSIDWPLTPYAADDVLMARMATTSSAPPCLAVFEQPKAMAELQGAFILLLDGIQDPGNLGALLRSALAFGVDTVVLTKDSVEPYNPKVIRASAGLVFALPVLSLERQALSQKIPASDWTVYTTTGDSSNALNYREADLSGRCVIVLGNEGRGVSSELFADRAVQALTIPMNTHVESLNVAISGSVILAEAAAQRRAGVRV